VLLLQQLCEVSSRGATNYEEEESRHLNREDVAREQIELKTILLIPSFF
jgi:hypothetical protein